MSVRGLRRGSIAASRAGGTLTTYTIYPTTDGWIQSYSGGYATARSGGSFVVVDTTDPLYVAQEFLAGTYYLTESFLRFDTSSVVGTIQSATLHLYKTGDNSVTDFTVEARSHAWGPTLTSADWVPGASLSGKTLLASWPTASGWSPGAYQALTSEAAFVSAVNQSGMTEILLCSSRRTSGTAPSGYETVEFSSSEASGTSQDPKLVIEALV